LKRPTPWKFWTALPDMNMMPPMAGFFGGADNLEYADRKKRHGKKLGKDYEIRI
jgi:hypothetical protein